MPKAYSRNSFVVVRDKQDPTYLKTGGYKFNFTQEIHEGHAIRKHSAAFMLGEVVTALTTGNYPEGLNQSLLELALGSLSAAEKEYRHLIRLGMTSAAAGVAGTKAAERYIQDHRDAYVFLQLLDGARRSWKSVTSLAQLPSILFVQAQL